MTKQNGTFTADADCTEHIVLGCLLALAGLLQPGGEVSGSHPC